MPCYSLVSLGESIPNVQTFAKKKHKVQPGVQVCSADAHRAHALAAALLNGMLNHPVWALSVNWRFPAGAGAQSAGRCCFPGEELAVPRARECWCSWMGPQRFQHNVSPGLQPPELAPLAAYCVLVGGFSTSVNLFLSFTTTPRALLPHLDGYCFFPARPGPGTSGIRSWHSRALFLSLPRSVTLSKADGRRGETVP